MNAPHDSSGSFLSSRRLGIAGVAALLGCVACCAAPLLVAAGVGSGVAGTLSSALQPGSEFLVGGVVFAGTLGAMALWGRLRRASSGGCGSACKVDGGCCDRSATREPS